MRLDAAKCPRTRWKNGGGYTRELAREGVGETSAWRLSLADIDENGPFSAFPGMKRIHTIIKGRGLTLQGDGTTLTALPFAPLNFDGGLALTAGLIDGPCRALNVIYDPGVCRITVDLLRGGTFHVREGKNVIFVLQGECTGPDSVALTCGQGQLIQAGGSFTGSDNSIVFLMGISDLLD